MTFVADDQSISSSAPVELYTFTAGTTIYRMTSCDEDFSFGGNVYTATAIARSNTRFSPTDEPHEQLVTMPASHVLLRDNVFTTYRSKLEVTITVVQQVSGTSQVLWAGPIVNVSVSGRTATLRVPSQLDDVLATPIPSRVFSRKCGHRLFDDTCKLVEATFTQSTTVSSHTGRTVVVGSVFGAVNGYYQAGEVVRVSDGERRLVVAQVGTTFTLSSPFPELVDGDSIHILAGCDHSAVTCGSAKFNNIDNFGGHPFIDAFLFVRANSLIRRIIGG
jgi:uncharacterized phage protein (TIGR02218 family)